MAGVSKKLVNEAAAVVEEMLEGAVLAQKGVRKLDGWNVLVRDDIDKVRDSQVALVSGGGSGHEPSHGGWIGEGMLSGMAAGPVFASPSTASILAAIVAVTGAKGCLLIVKNYTGDRLNFGLAAEQAKARGLQVDLVVVGDDCALPHRDSAIAGRRGVAGTVFVHKVAGAAAAMGRSLSEVRSAAFHAASRVGSMGVALSVCSLPGKAEDQRLGHDRCEVGLGIHGEPGALTQPMQPCDQLVDQALEFVFKQDDGWGYMPAPDANTHVALLVNNLGSTTPMELSIVTRRAVATLTAKYHVHVDRLLVGTFMTSLDMRGFSLSVLCVDDALTTALDAPTLAPAWPNTVARPSEACLLPPVPCPQVAPAAAVGGAASPHLSPSHAALFKRAVGAGCEAVKAMQNSLTEWDKKVGDGDCGDTLAGGAAAVAAALDAINFEVPAAAFAQIAHHTESMGGTSGAVYTILFTAAAAAFANSNSPQATPQDWATALRSAVDSVSRYGGARAGDRTMLDALFPASHALSDGVAKGIAASALTQEVARAADQGAASTQLMVARAGRASYVPAEVSRTVPDPGAMAAAAWVKAVAQCWL